MLLFLDVISPIPEFLLIEDNKVILQRKIINKESEKLSDNIFLYSLKKRGNLIKFGNKNLVAKTSLFF